MSDAYRTNEKGERDLVHVAARRSGNEVNANVAVASRSAADLAPKAKGGAPPKQKPGQSQEDYMREVREWRTKQQSSPAVQGQRRALERMRP